MIVKVFFLLLFNAPVRKLLGYFVYFVDKLPKSLLVLWEYSVNWQPALAYMQFGTSMEYLIWA